MERLKQKTFVIIHFSNICTSSECISWLVVSACSFIDDSIIRRVPGLCSAHLDFYNLLLLPTYVKLHDLHLNLYTIPFTCVSVGLSFGLRNTFPNVSISLNDVWVLTPESIRFIQSDTPLMYRLSGKHGQHAHGQHAKSNPNCNPNPNPDYYFT